MSSHVCDHIDGFVADFNHMDVRSSMNHGKRFSKATVLVAIGWNNGMEKWREGSEVFAISNQRQCDCCFRIGTLDGQKHGFYHGFQY